MCVCDLRASVRARSGAKAWLGSMPTAWPATARRVSLFLSSMYAEVSRGPVRLLCAQAAAGA